MNHPEPQPPIDVFVYDNYRVLLRDLMEEMRKRSKAYTLRALAQRAGFASHSFLSHLLRGERKLSLESAEKLAPALGLQGRRAQYFRTLVQFNQAETAAERERSLLELKKLRGSSYVAKVNESQYAYYDRWYLPVLRELAVYGNWRGDYVKLGRMLRNPISAKEAQEGVALLLRIGLLKRIAGERFALTDVLVSADGVPGVVFRQARTEYLLRAIEATENLPKTERHASYAVLGTTRKKFEEYTQRMDALRREFLQGLDPDDPVEAVYAVCLQAFPLTHSIT